MFKSLPGAAIQPPLSLIVDGRPVTAHRGDTLAMALLKAGVVPTRRTAVSNAPRAPMCLMGVCFDCLVEVDGRQVQSCMTEVREGMSVHLPHGAHNAEGQA